MTRARWIALTGALVVIAAGIGAWVMGPGTDRDDRDAASRTTTTTANATTSPSGPTGPTVVDDGPPSTSTDDNGNRNGDGDIRSETTHPPTTETTVREQLPPDEPVLAPGGTRAARDLDARPYCDDDDPGRGLVEMSWTAANDQGSEQRVQVTRFPDGFESGQYDLSPPLDPGAPTYLYDNPQGTARHLWRVLTRHPDGWVPSETDNFHGPGCIADQM